MPEPCGRDLVQGLLADARVRPVPAAVAIEGGAHHEILVDMAEHVIDRVHHPVGDVIDRAIAGPARPPAGGCASAADLTAFADEMLIAPWRRARPGRASRRRRKSRVGASLDGDFTSPASMAASPSVNSGAEVLKSLRGRLDAVGAGAEIAPIQIQP